VRPANESAAPQLTADTGRDYVLERTARLVAVKTIGPLSLAGALAHNSNDSRASPPLWRVPIGPTRIAMLQITDERINGFDAVVEVVLLHLNAVSVDGLLSRPQLLEW
jgi:hypothetical protein